VRSLWRPLPNPNTVGIGFELASDHDFADSGPKVKSHLWLMDSRSLSDSVMMRSLSLSAVQGDFE
jgi:hypothetical protein